MKGDCPALAEKMYNCSRLFEVDSLSTWYLRYTRGSCYQLDLAEVWASDLKLHIFMLMTTLTS